MNSLRSIQNSQPPQFIGRKWQLEALRQFNRLRSKGREDFLLVAAPAAGKTLFGLEAARTLLREGAVERVVVVAHSNHLRRQWARAAERVGVQLDDKWSNADGIESPDDHGVVVTYHQVACAPDLYRMNCLRKTLVIFDEIHHAGDRKAWGDAVRQAFEPAAFRLGMSGTLFRCDNRRIPFVRYEAGCSKPDFTYGFRDAVADGVCRPVYFLTYEGEIIWLREGSEELHEHSLLDVVDRKTAAARLRAALDPTKGWMRNVVKQANMHLTKIRENGHADAGALVVAMDQEHAKSIARLVREVCQEEPVLAISEDPNASSHITEFAAGEQRWIITVRMVSEGVDIPRLRLGVYATNIQTELFLRQVVGRLTRYTKGQREQSAVLYLPADEVLMRYALEIMEEREHYIGSEAEEDLDGLLVEKGFAVSGEDWGERMTTALSAEMKEYDAIFDGESFAQPELTAAAKVCREKGITAPFVHVASIWRLAAAQAGVFIRHGESSRSVVSHHSQSPSAPIDKISAGRMKVLREQTEGIAQSLAHQLEVSPDEIHREWVSGLGGMTAETATGEDLERKLEWLKYKLRDEIEAKGHRVGSRYYSLSEIKERL